jgi:hypothetical protein
MPQPRDLLRCLVVMAAVLGPVPEAAPGGRAASAIHGRVYLQDGGPNHAGSTILALAPSARVGIPAVWPGGVVLCAAGALLLARRRRTAARLAVLGALGLAGAAMAALRSVSDTDGAYELTPGPGGSFEPGAWRLTYEHAGYQRVVRTLTLTGSEGAIVQAPDVTLQPLPSCSIFPPDNPWNTDISAYPVHPNSADYISFIGAGDHLHPDFGTFWEGAPIGIPYVEVPTTQPKLPVAFLYDDESDPGPYPIPPSPPIEGGASSDGDRHILMLDRGACLLYELYWAWPPGQGENPYQDRWYAGSGAVFDLGSNALRPDGWTSADAAGLPIYPGLVRYDEVVEQRRIDHALRFTVRQTQRGYIHPATHFASDSTAPNRPPMGLRLRMKPGYDCSGYSDEVQVICAALKKYGMLVADNGSDWYVSGAHDPRWDDDALGDLKRIPGSAFQAVSTGSIRR